MATVAPLDVYRAKRSFDETPEPSGESATEAGWRYAIQKHDATRLHYDLRLELDGVLLSWAITRGPSLDPADKRLAVRTEDHPIDYAGFEGVIPSGYGEGTVMLWDRGSWEPIGDPHAELKAGKIAFHLYGERLHGRWALVRMKPRPGEKRENWLFIKEKDAEVSTRGDVLKKHDKSVASARTMAQIAKGAPAPKASETTPSGKNTTEVSPAQKPPAFVAPQLASLVDKVPVGHDWLFEIKFDGYRAQIAAAGDRVRIHTRSGLDWTERFPGVAAGVRKLKLDRCLIDGEIVALDEDGISDFGALQSALEEGRTASLVCFAFDLLVDGGEDIRQLPLTERKARLKLRLGPGGARGPVFFADDFDDGAAGLAALSAKGFEGVIAKKRDAAYRSGRARSWLKIKTGHEQEFVVVGFSPSENGRTFASVLVATWEGRRLVYAGRVGSGFSDATLTVLSKRFSRLARKTPPLADVPPGAIGRNASWIEPKLVAQIAFASFTRDHQIRHGRYLALREDKTAKDVKRETAETAPAAKSARRDAGQKPKSPASVNVRLTHPERELYPGVSKRDVADYLATVAPRMLPLVQNRALSLMRCPEGIDGERFFQKHATAGLPEAVGRTTTSEPGKTKREERLFIGSEAAVIAAAQVSALELHIGGARLDRFENPDRMVLDLDPDEAVTFETVRDAAFGIRDALEALGLQSFVLLTGGKGVHVVVPLDRRRGWDDVQAFSRALAERFEAHDPENFVATMSKARRTGRIFIDHFRNARAATAIAPYSLRARPGAPVAAPVTWNDLGKIERANTFRIGDAAALAAADPWNGYSAVRQTLAAKAMRALGL